MGVSFWDTHRVPVSPSDRAESPGIFCEDARLQPHMATGLHGADGQEWESMDEYPDGTFFF